MKREKFIVEKRCPICLKLFVVSPNHSYHVEADPKKKEVCSYKCESLSIDIAEKKRIEKRRKKLEKKYEKGARKNEKNI